MNKKLMLTLLVFVSTIIVGCDYDDQADLLDDYSEDESDDTSTAVGTMKVEIIPNPDQERIPTKKPDHLFEKGGFWNTKLGDVEIDPKSEEMKNGLMNTAAEDGFLFARKEWTVPVYFADANTPRYDVPMVIDWTPVPNMVMKDVPIPPWTREDPARGDGSNPFTNSEEDVLGDAEMTIVDTSVEPWVAYDFWQARQIDESGKRVFSDEDRKNAKWVASWGAKMSLDDDSFFPCGLSGRGSGSSYMAGMIWPEELAAGEINHRIIFSFTHNHVDGPIPPFTENDGWISEAEMKSELGRNDVYPIPEGAIVQLDPELDLDSFVGVDPETGEERGLTDYEKTIAKAMQEYGMVDVDNSGAVQLYGVSELSYEEDPYTMLPDDTYVYFLPELLEHVRVLKMGALLGTPDTTLTEEMWGDYSCDDGEDCIPDEFCEG